MRHLQAYAAGGDAHERGEPAQPPATVPRQRKDAWLKGWADQRAFMEGRLRSAQRQPAGWTQNRDKLLKRARD